MTTRLERSRKDLLYVLAEVEVGTRDRPVKVRRFALAVRHMDDWLSQALPKHGVRGGTSSPVESDDRAEAARLTNQILRDASRLPVVLLTATSSTHAGEFSTAVAELYAITVRYSETIHPNKFPTDIPGCRSCAREQTKNAKDGHFSPVVDEAIARKVHGKDAAALALKVGLCRWCWDHALAASDKDGHPGRITRRYWPPLGAIDRYHRHGPQAAGRWLAEQALPRKQRRVLARTTSGR